MMGSSPRTKSPLVGQSGTAKGWAVLDGWNDKGEVSGQGWILSPVLQVTSSPCCPANRQADPSVASCHEERLFSSSLPVWIQDIPRACRRAVCGHWSWAPLLSVSWLGLGSQDSASSYSIPLKSELSFFSPTIPFKHGGSLANSTSALDLQTLLAQMDRSPLYHGSRSLQIPRALIELVTEYLCLSHCPLSPQQPCTASCCLITEMKMGIDNRRKPSTTSFGPSVEKTTWPFS